MIAQASAGALAVNDLTNLLFLAAGMGVGFLTTVRILKKAFASWRDQLMSFLLGLLLASWYVLWPYVEMVGIDHDAPILIRVLPWQLPTNQSLGITAIVTVVAIGVYYLHQWADRRDAASPKPDDGFDRL